MKAFLKELFYENKEVILYCILILIIMSILLCVVAIDAYLTRANDYKCIVEICNTAKSILIK